MASPPDTAPPGPAPSRVSGVAGRHPLALIWLGTVLYSTGPVMVGAASASGPVLSFWRLWIGVVVMGAATLVHARITGGRPDREGWAWAAKAGALFGVHQLLFMIAVKTTSVVDVTLMQVLAPLFVSVLAVRLFGERPGRRFRLWSLVAILGAAVVVLAGAAGPEGAPLGMALAAANVGFFALYFVLSKQARAFIDVVPFLFGMILAAAVTVSAYVAVTGEHPGSATWRDLALAAAIAVIPGALGHLVSTHPLRTVAANVPPVVQLTIPFLAGAMAWVVLDQRITALHLLGGAVTIVGVSGAIRSKATRPGEKAAP